MDPKPTKPRLEPDEEVHARTGAVHTAEGADAAAYRKYADQKMEELLEEIESLKEKVRV